MKKHALIMAIGLACIMMLYFLGELYLPTGPALRNIEVRIPQGATFRQAADILHSEKLIRDRTVFIILGRMTGADRKIRAGYYSFWGSMRPIDIFGIIRKGKIIEYEVRVLEGDSLLEIGDTFAKTGIITYEDFQKLAKNRAFLHTHDIKAPSIEGYVFPDTYIIPKGISAEEALGLMIDRLREKFTDDMKARAAQLNMTENQVLTLASIIEKEAAVDPERPLVSAVYHNRLRKKMPLQADPTSIYGIKSSRERITRSDLRRKTPYNTYVIKGLPPGPIASPGLKSIKAALFPENVPYLFFVSNNDGTHQFSVTQEEHAEAVRLYRQRKQEMKMQAEKNDAT